MEKLESCPVCNATVFKHFLTCKDFTVSKEEFDIVSCSSCGFKFTNPRPEVNKLGAYYESEEYISHSNTSKGLVNSLYQGVRKYTLIKKLQLINRLNPKATLLDIGCGTGEFLNVCKEYGWKTTGIEPDEKARNYGVENYNLDVKPENELKNLADHSFEIITMWHVLEHVPDLNKRIEEIKRILKLNGTLVVAVPNCDSLDAKIYGKYWAAYDVPRHLYHFTPKDIENLFRKHEMKVSRVLPMIFDSFYVSLLSEKYKNGTPGLIKGFFNGLRSNLAAIKTGRKYSSQIYIIRNF